MPAEPCLLMKYLFLTSLWLQGHEPTDMWDVPSLLFLVQGPVKPAAAWVTVHLSGGTLGVDLL